MKTKLSECHAVIVPAHVEMEYHGHHVELIDLSLRIDGIPVRFHKSRLEALEFARQLIDLKTIFS